MASNRDRSRTPMRSRGRSRTRSPSYSDGTYSDSFVSDDESYRTAQGKSSKEPVKSKDNPKDKGRRGTKATNNTKAKKGAGRNSKAQISPRAIDNVTKRMLSARRIKINEMRNEVEDLNVQLVELRQENKMMKRQQHVTNRALDKYEIQENDMPSMIQRHSEETRAVKEQARKQKERFHKTEKKLRSTEEELERTRRLLKKMRGLVNDKQLAERDELNQKLSRAELDISEKDAKIQDLERHTEHLNKNHKHELGIERARFREVHRQLQELQTKYKETEMRLKEKEKELEVRNIYSNRLVRPPHKLNSSVSSSPLPGSGLPPRSRHRKNSTPGLTPRERAKDMEDRRRMDMRKLRELSSSQDSTPTHQAREPPGYRIQDRATSPDRITEVTEPSSGKPRQPNNNYSQISTGVELSSRAEQGNYIPTNTGSGRSPQNVRPPTPRRRSSSKVKKEHSGLNFSSQPNSSLQPSTYPDTNKHSGGFSRIDKQSPSDELWRSLTPGNTAENKKGGYFFMTEDSSERLAPLAGSKRDQEARERERLLEENAQQLRQQREGARKEQEIQEWKAQAEEERRRAEEVKRKSEEDQMRAEDERRRAEEERRRAEEERRRAEEDRKKEEMLQKIKKPDDGDLLAGWDDSHDNREKQEIDRKNREEQERREREDRERRDREENEQREREERERQTREMKERGERERMEMEQHAHEEQERLSRDSSEQERQRQKKLLLARMHAIDTDKGSFVKEEVQSPNSKKKEFQFTRPIENMHHGKPAYDNISVPVLEKNKKKNLEDDEVGGYQPSFSQPGPRGAKKTQPKKLSLFDDDADENSAPNFGKMEPQNKGTKTNLMESLFGNQSVSNTSATKKTIPQDPVFGSASKTRKNSQSGQKQNRENSSTVLFGGGSALVDHSEAPPSSNSHLLPRRQQQRSTTVSSRPTVKAVDDFEDDIEEVVL